MLKRRMMKYSEFRRWLLEQGAQIRPGKGSHQKVSLNGKSSTFPYHGAKEIGTGLVAKIKRDLGLKN
jgi:mRNA interferase HicA